MSMNNDAVLPRPRDAMLDILKLQLLSQVNQLRTEVMLYKAQRRTFFSQFFMADRIIRQEHEFFVNSINDRVQMILDAAKNLLSDPNDPEHLEYMKFENLTKDILNLAVYRRKWFGFKIKRMQ